jgi:uncharacterized protein YndB with AHSA1/START domain
MPDILHRISINAPQEHVHDLIATTDGVARWWTGRPLDGDATVGSSFGVYFGDPAKPSAVMEVMSDTADEVVWRVVDGPDEWIDTLITFTMKDAGNGGTTLLFSQSGWRAASEFMSNCSTNWGAYLTSLRNGAEGREFSAYPNSEVSRWN